MMKRIYKALLAGCVVYLYKFASLFKLTKRIALSLSFTGGFGAQLISTLIYWHASDKNIKLYCDFTYFDKIPCFNKGKSDGGLSIFPWELSLLGIYPKDFRKYANKPLVNLVIRDGYEKFQLFLEAVSSTSIREKFKEHLEAARSSAAQNIHKIIKVKHPYICVHLRRGDYLSVASHIIKTKSALSLLSKLYRAEYNLVVSSDTVLSEQEKRDFLNLNYRKTYFYDDGSICSFEAFLLMYDSNILVASNSQFSLCAGLLSDTILYIPTKWFGQNSHTAKNQRKVDETSKIELSLISSCEYALWDHPEERKDSLLNKFPFKIKL